MKTIADYQTEHAEWEMANFGPQLPERCHLGLIEEVGELAHAVLKQQQGIRGTTAEHDVAIRDAVGDILVYLLGYCTARQLKLKDHLIEGVSSFQDVHEVAFSEHTIYANVKKPMNHPVDYWVRDASKTLTGVWLQNNWDIEALVFALARICCIKGWNIQDVFDDTWTKVVKKRNWKKDPLAGEEPVPDTLRGDKQ